MFETTWLRWWSWLSSLSVQIKLDFFLCDLLSVTLRKLKFYHVYIEVVYSLISWQLPLREACNSDITYIIKRNLWLKYYEPRKISLTRLFILGGKACQFWTALPVTHFKPVLETNLSIHVLLKIWTKAFENYNYSNLPYCGIHTVAKENEIHWNNIGFAWFNTSICACTIFPINAS